MSYSFDMTTFPSDDFPHAWSPFNTTCTRSNLGEFQKNSGNDSIPVRECLCWSSVRAICGHYKHPFLSFPWHWKNLCLELSWANSSQFIIYLFNVISLCLNYLWTVCNHLIIFFNNLINNFMIHPRAQAKLCKYKLSARNKQC